MSLLVSKTTNYELREFPTAIRPPPKFYADHPEGPDFVNTVNFLPEELMPKGTKKGAMLVGMQTSASASATTSRLASSATEKANPGKEDVEDKEDGQDNNHEKEDEVEEEEDDNDAAEEDEGTQIYLKPNRCFTRNLSLRTC
jgi:hypothetical protein